MMSMKWVAVPCFILLCSLHESNGFSFRPMKRVLRGVSKNIIGDDTSRAVTDRKRGFQNYRVNKLINTLNAASTAVPAVSSTSKGALFGISLKRVPSLYALLAAATLAFIAWWRKTIWTASRTYNREANTVGNEYDAWTTEGILEYYWGEHIHLGYYTEEERLAGYKKKNFIEAKYDFIDRMAEFGQIGDEKPATVLDVGCGIGGTSRYLAKKFGVGTEVTGITLSSEQQKRATALAQERGITNANFQVMDALEMKFPDNSFDVVWACESGEHMPDKKRYIEEMTRVLKPGGKIVIATWCQRDDSIVPFTKDEKKTLQFLYDEWTHPYFISIEEYEKIMNGTGKLESIKTDDWAIPTIPSWRHSIWVGVYDPWPVIKRPHLWWKCFRDGLTLERMHGAFSNGLMQYGMMTSTKKV